MLPVKIKPFKHELLESWIYRLSKANGFDNVNDFYTFYFMKPIRRNYNLYKNFYRVLDEVGIDDYSSFIREHTTYPLLALFMDAYRQSLILDLFSGLNKKTITTQGRSYYYCPRCNENNSYFKVYHNLPGVVICPIHHETLLNIENSKPVVEEVSQYNINYSEYCYNLYLNLPDFDSNFFPKYTNFENGIKMLMNEYPDYNFPDHEKIALESGIDYKILYESNNLSEFIHLVCGEHFCMSVKPYNLGFKCPSCREPDEEFYKKLIENSGKYKMIRYGRPNTTIEHKECGSVYDTRIPAFVNGSRCICETRFTLPKLIAEFAIRFPEFKVVDYRDKRIYLIHKVCGENFDANFQKWLKYPGCRKCNPKVVLNEGTVREFVNSVGFKLLECDDANKVRKIKVECPAGHIRTVKYYTFKDSPECPACNSLRKKKKIKDIAKYINDNQLNNRNIIIAKDLNKSLNIQVRHKHLTDLGYKNICYGVYSKTKVSDEEIIIAKYINGNDVIGYTYGETFAYELGLVDKPTITSICTGKEASYKSRITKVNNTKVRLRKLIEGFDSEHWQEWQLIDFMKSKGLYKGNKIQSEVIDSIIGHIESNKLDTSFLFPRIAGKDIYSKSIREYINEKKKQEN